MPECRGGTGSLDQGGGALARDEGGRERGVRVEAGWCRRGPGPGASTRRGTALCWGQAACVCSTRGQLGPPPPSEPPVAHSPSRL